MHSNHDDEAVEAYRKVLGAEAGFRRVTQDYLQTGRRLRRPEEIRAGGLGA